MSYYWNVLIRLSLLIEPSIVLYYIINSLMHITLDCNDNLRPYFGFRIVVIRSFNVRTFSIVPKNIPFATNSILKLASRLDFGEAETRPLLEPTIRVEQWSSMIKCRRFESLRINFKFVQSYEIWNVCWCWYKIRFGDLIELSTFDKATFKAYQACLRTWGKLMHLQKIYYYYYIFHTKYASFIESWRERERKWETSSSKEQRVSQSKWKWLEPKIKNSSS